MGKNATASNKAFSVKVDAENGEKKFYTIGTVKFDLSTYLDVVAQPVTLDLVGSRFPGATISF